MTFVYSAEQSRQTDAAAIAEMGIPGYTLMQRAAGFTWDCLLHDYPDVRTITVWCGKGNNAGDAYLVAALAHRAGLAVQVLAVEPTASLTGDAETAFAHAEESGVAITPWSDGDDVPAADVHVDGLLGTGVRGAARGDVAQAIAALNAAPGAVVSVDLPSGVDASTGGVGGVAVYADLVTTFITRKVCGCTGPALDYFEELAFSDLSVDGSCYAPSDVCAISFESIRQYLPHPGINTYKHRQGHVYVCGGDLGMPGAVALASRAAMRSGAGMVTCVTQPQHRAALVARTPEVMVSEVDELGEREAGLIVLGPGLGRSPWSEKLYRRVEALSGDGGIPVVLDADGLYWLAQTQAETQGEDQAWAGGPLTITPHVAEAARLLSISAGEVQQDRLTASRNLAARFNCQGVLKGAGSVIFSGIDGEHELAICMDGNPGMASAGMGDVLSGVVGAMLGQLPSDANSTQNLHRLQLAVCLHSAAADRGAEVVGQLSLIASDVIDCLPDVMVADA